MLKLTANTSSKGRACDRCRSAGSTVYCRSDSAFFCTTCDARIHANCEHERVWVCEACEQNPSAYRCKADAASLCVPCDVDIHSANPLARRHHRVPVLPIPGPLYGPSAGGLLMSGHGPLDKDGELCDEDDLTESWLMIKNGGGGEDHALAVDEYLDLEEYGTTTTTTYTYEGDNGNKNSHNDSVVPFTSDQAKDDKVRQCWFQLGLEFEGSSNADYGSYPINDSTVISLPSMDVGVVPEAASSEVSISHQRPSKGIIDLFTESAVDVPPIQLSPADREARVLRYREKKKTRRFEKTIRYASRKAYAETRPRIKGRFAKRAEVDADVDPMFSAESIMSETGYGIVPSF